MKDEIKAIKLLQQGVNEVSNSHLEIDQDLEDIKEFLSKAEKDGSYLEISEISLESNTPKKEFNKSFSDIVKIANKEIKEDVSFRDILSNDDLLEIDNKVNTYVKVFNKKHELDAWDYAISGGVGVFCGILDVLFIKKPLKYRAKYSQKVDGLFNQWSQSSINKLIPTELSKILEKSFKIGGADSRISQDFSSSISGKFNPINHRLKSLNHDPILAFFIGALDVMNGTCTIVDNGSVKVLKTVRGASGDYSFFEALGMMFGHLASDFNAPSSKGNRGMGIPAPLIGLFGALKGINIGGKDIAEISEYMYINGYDSRHFATLSIPVLINEILIRVLYIIKEVKCNNRTFIDVFKETIPLNISPRFRMVLNLSYGGMVAINAGKVVITKNILNANYAMWMVFTWHTLHSIQWLLWTKNVELQKYIDKKLKKDMKDLQYKISELSEKVDLL